VFRGQYSRNTRIASTVGGGVTLKYTLDSIGVIEGVRFITSPNCDERPPGVAIDLLVIHAISLPPGEFGGDDVIDLFTNRLDASAHPYYAGLLGLRVSAHFLIRRGGECLQFVPCSLRAWHAGVSCWRDRSRCNDFSIGIELEGDDETPFEDVQYDRLATLTQVLRSHYPIAEIVGHAEIAPGRKTDPGPSFDWGRYRASL
jgi:AmpD protein